MKLFVCLAVIFFSIFSHGADVNYVASLRPEVRDRVRQQCIDSDTTEPRTDGRPCVPATIRAAIESFSPGLVGRNWRVTGYTDQGQVSIAADESINNLIACLYFGNNECRDNSADRSRVRTGAAQSAIEFRGARTECFCANYNTSVATPIGPGSNFFGDGAEFITDAFQPTLVSDPPSPTVYGDGVREFLNRHNGPACLRGVVEIREIAGVPSVVFSSAVAVYARTVSDLPPLEANGEPNPTATPFRYVRGCAGGIEGQHSMHARCLHDRDCVVRVEIDAGGGAGQTQVLRSLAED